ncbi:FHA domain-containing protein [Streptomyces sp. NPDC012751]|uniref:FHA domain-containing protein n=1 Tax=Streptomyces sp. NPDC012751 TaxID=3364846 RepID=UPI00367F97F1
MTEVSDWDDDEWETPDRHRDGRTHDDAPAAGEPAPGAPSAPDDRVPGDPPGPGEPTADDAPYANAPYANASHADAPHPDEWETVGGATTVRAPTPPPRPSPKPVGQRCPACRAVLPPGTDVCPACLSPVGAGRRPRRLPGGVLRLEFRTGGGHLDVPRGTALRLGRSGSWAPEAAVLLAGEETVSAQHATVEHTEDGAAWVTEVPRGATNGTRVNDRVLVPNQAVRLSDGDRVELGPRVGFVVRGIEDGPDAATG